MCSRAIKFWPPLSSVPQAKLQAPEYHAVPSLTRYFNHVQFDKTVRTAADAQGSEFSLVDLDVENAPIPVRQAPPVKKKEKKDKAPEAAAPSPAAGASAAAATPAPAAEGAPEQQQQKKEKKEKKPKDAAAAGADAGKKAAAGGGGKGAKAPAADDGEPVPSMIDLRVGHIVDSTSALHLTHALVSDGAVYSHEAP